MLLLKSLFFLKRDLACALRDYLHVLFVVAAIFEAVDTLGGELTVLSLECALSALTPASKGVVALC